MYEQFINILEKEISDRIWMPYQIGLEYQKNRVKQVKDREREFKDIISKIKGLKGTLNNDNCRNLINQIHTDSYFIDLSKYMDLNLIDENFKKIDDKFKEIDEIIDSIKENIDGNIDFLDNDEIRDKLDTIFEDKVGDNYPPSKLKEIYEEGVYRYTCKIPPGYGDRKKNSGNPYGDLIIWHQIMDYAKSKEVPIIFVTDEEKKDWWQIYQHNNEKEFIRPDHHLLQEFASTGQDFYMVRFGEFLDKTKKYLKADVEPEVIEAVKVIEELQDLEEEIEEKETEEMARTGSVNPAFPFAAQEAIRQAGLIRAAGSGSALQLAAQEAKRQADMYRATMPNLQLVAQEMKRQQEMTVSDMMPSLRLAAQELKRQQEMTVSDMMPSLRLAAQELKRQQEMTKAAGLNPTLPLATKKAEKKNEEDHQADSESKEDNE